MSVEVTEVAPSDAGAAVAVIALAFCADPVVRWSFSDPERFLEAFPAFVRAFGGKAFGEGAATQVAGFRGAALWLPPGVAPDEEAMGAILESSVAPERLKDVAALMQQMEAHHPKGPHWHLPLIGVDPAHQGNGLGGALLAHTLARCDRDGAAAYLESSNPANIPLYERHGFKVLGALQSGSSPPVFPMLRKGAGS
jgi:ribosomal protein S18 acetylase RimI-like enzyme